MKGARDDGHDQLPCPVCRRVTHSTVSSLPGNILLRHISDHHVQQKESDPRCTSCSGVSATVRYRCHNFGGHYCEPCCRKHRMFTNHDEIEDLQSKFTSVQRVFCGKHQKELRKYCTNCSFGLCADCLENHSTCHRIVSLGDRSTIHLKRAKIELHRQELSRDLEEAEKRTTMLQSVHTQLNDAYAANNSKLLQYFNTLREILDTAYEKLETERHERKVAIEKDLSIIQEGLNFYISSCQNLDSFINRLLTEDSQFVSPLPLYGDVLSRMSTLRSSMPDPELVHTIPVYEFKENDAFLESFKQPGWWYDTYMNISFEHGEASLTLSPTSPSPTERNNFSSMCMEALGINEVSTSLPYTSIKELSKSLESINNLPSGDFPPYWHRSISEALHCPTEESGVPFGSPAITPDLDLKPGMRRSLSEKVLSHDKEKDSHKKGTVGKWFRRQLSRLSLSGAYEQMV